MENGRGPTKFSAGHYCLYPSNLPETAPPQGKLRHGLFPLPDEVGFKSFCLRLAESGLVYNRSMVTNRLQRRHVPEEITFFEWCEFAILLLIKDAKSEKQERVSWFFEKFFYHLKELECVWKIEPDGKGKPTKVREMKPVPLLNEPLTVCGGPLKHNILSPLWNGISVLGERGKASSLNPFLKSSS